MNAPLTPTQRLHILYAEGYYIGQLRLFGHRRWKTVTGHCRRAEHALSRAIAKMAPTHHRARVLFVDSTGYYGPRVSMEAKHV